MLRTCVHHGNYQEALNLFQRMQWDVEANPALILDALRPYVATGNYWDHKDIPVIRATVIQTCMQNEEEVLIRLGLFPINYLG